VRLMPSAYEPVTILILAPGAFFVLACLIAVQNKVRINTAKRQGNAVSVCERENSCAGCTNTLCGGKTFTEESVKKEKEAER
ncbi:MAG: electron transport complex subunit E, partial [Clostridium sp.]|nr:electron transport complex subunit E [Clostridium sp.]